MSPTVAQGLAVMAGAAVGALLRWQTGLWLNPLWHGFPLGTLAVNVGGGLAVGALCAWLAAQPDEMLRLLLVTGFLGGLTTFSAFSAESLSLLQRGAYGLALVHSAAHVLASLGAAAIGWRLVYSG